MARCPYLEWENKGTFSNYKDGYSCKLVHKNLEANEVKYKCYPGFGDSYGDDYEECTIYKERK